MVVGVPVHLCHTPKVQESQYLPGTYFRSPLICLPYDVSRSTTLHTPQVGYILGLGDRHPSNLMLDRYSGKLLHIDFGDCFEASMTREKFPEKVWGGGEFG